MQSKNSGLGCSLRQARPVYCPWTNWQRKYSLNQAIGTCSPFIRLWRMTLWFKQALLQLTLLLVLTSKLWHIQVMMYLITTSSLFSSFCDWTSDIEILYPYTWYFPAGYERRKFQFICRDQVKPKNQQMLTFEEFFKCAVLQMEEGNYNRHWEPIFRRCAICDNPYTDFSKFT